MSTFRRRGRIHRSRINPGRISTNEDHWAEVMGDDLDYEVEELAPEKPRLRRKGIYLLPNAFTTAALFSGFFAIVNAMNDQFQVAAIAIFASLVLDGMDGRVARMTNTQSAFGEQYDSLADMVSFGVAPALVAYEWALKDLGKWGWLAAFTYCAGAALRLARFNVNTGVVDKKFFQGLPSPAAGSLIAGFIWLADDNKIPVRDSAIPWITFFIAVYAGLTMVSNARFYSGKALDVRYRVPFGVMVLLILTFVLISSNPPLTLFGLFVIYSASGYVIWAWERLSGRRFS